MRIRTMRLGWLEAHRAQSTPRTTHAHRLADFPVCDRRAMPVGRMVAIGNLRFKAFAVEHSRHAPAVGLRVCVAGRLVYVPDVSEIPDRPRPLQGALIYIGDGATVRRPMVRRKAGGLIGHAAIATQLDWRKETGITEAIFTHCGSPIVRGSATKFDAMVRELGIERGIDAFVAVDGLTLSLGSRRTVGIWRRRTRRSPRHGSEEVE
jgi:hypothetical protein